MTWKRKPIARDFTSQSQILSSLQHRPFQILYYGKRNIPAPMTSYPSAWESARGVVTRAQAVVAPALPQYGMVGTKFGNVVTLRTAGEKPRRGLTYTPMQATLAATVAAPARMGTRPPPDFSGAESTAAGRSAYIAKWGSF
jgi:hypothetical protein